LSSRRQVAPAEIEDVLVSHPFVAEGTVCAKWNEVRGTEVPIAYIKLSESGKTYQDGIGAALEVVKDFVDARVAPYKRLRGGVEILDEIPKTASGKVLKRLLPARLEMQRRSKV
jgi:4-coumarate--CoA ligase